MNPRPQALSEAVPALNAICVGAKIDLWDLIDPRHQPQRSRGHFHAAAGRRAKLRKACASILRFCPRWKDLPVEVTLTRYSAGRLDAHDGLRTALKPVVDEVALYLPLDHRIVKTRTSNGTVERLQADDSDERVTWQYEQGRCARGTTHVTVRFARRNGP